MYPIDQGPLQGDHRIVRAEQGLERRVEVDAVGQRGVGRDRRFGRQAVRGRGRCIFVLATGDQREGAGEGHKTGHEEAGHGNLHPGSRRTIRPERGESTMVCCGPTRLLL